MKYRNHVFISCLIIFSFLVLFSYVSHWDIFALSYESIEQDGLKNAVKDIKIIKHIDTPDSVKAVYMTSWVAGTPNLREKIVGLIDRTELNSVVIDIKDYSGIISFKNKQQNLVDILEGEYRIKDAEDFIKTLHDKNIYVIGRLSVFQDAYYVKKRPDLAVKKESNKNMVWADRKGISWIDPGSREFWDYIVSIGKEAYDLGFDEINFDYIRFPSDGDMYDIYYPWSGTSTKSLVLKEFFEYTSSKFKPLNIPISADLFGMTTTNIDDLNIGQVLEHALSSFDFVSPMVYPSHYPPGWNGFVEPESEPYSVIYISMDSAKKRAEAMGVSPLKLRPWLQDFGIRVNYGKDEVQAQIKAVYDSGLNSWMLWNASNRYTKEALSQEITDVQ